MSDKTKKLLENAQADGNLSPAGAQALVLCDPGAQIQAALGISIDDVPAADVLLVTILCDDSGSIRFCGNAQAVREGHNLVLDSLATSRQRDAVLVHTAYLNGQVLCPYIPLSGAPKMDAHNYDPNGNTPLYDQTVVVLGTVLAKTQELLDAGVAVRTVTLLLTDGADVNSTRAGATEVAALVRDMLRSERHIVAAMGISDGKTDFRLVFANMGIEDRWILVPGNDASEIRRAFQVFSQSAVRLSQGMPARLGGFTN